MPDIGKSIRVAAAVLVMAVAAAPVQSGAAALKTEAFDPGRENPYPPIGRVAVVDFGKAVFRLHFTDNRTMSFEDASGAFQGAKDTVAYTAVEVGENLFMVYWHEPTTGSNVVHLQDFNSGTVYTNIAARDGSFTHLKGTITLH